MTEFREQDLSGARFEGVNLRAAALHDVEHRLCTERDLTALQKAN